MLRVYQILSIADICPRTQDPIAFTVSTLITETQSRRVLHFCHTFRSYIGRVDSQQNAALYDNESNLQSPTLVGLQLRGLLPHHRMHGTNYPKDLLP